MIGENLLGKGIVEAKDTPNFVANRIGTFGLMVLAYVMAGGNVPFGTKVSEEYLLELEREAFLSLVGEAQSQQRMQHMLVKGKPLRN